MNEEQAFLDVIAANPAEATTRLVLADWLEERDDPRGEWLRVRSQLALGTADAAELIRLEVRERELAPIALAGWFTPGVPVWCLLGGGLPYPPVPQWLVKENSDSWAGMIDFYADLQGRSWEYLGAIRQFVAALAGTEIARLFCAGQSLVTFIVSTADRHGLSDTDAMLWVEPRPQTPRFRLGYEAPKSPSPYKWPHQRESLSVESDDEVSLRSHFLTFLVRLWCDTRGRVSVYEV